MIRFGTPSCRPRLLQRLVRPGNLECPRCPPRVGAHASAARPAANSARRSRTRTTPDFFLAAFPAQNGYRLLSLPVALGKREPRWLPAHDLFGACTRWTPTTDSI